MTSAEAGRYCGLVLIEARKDARSANPALCATASISRLDTIDLMQADLVDLVRRELAQSGPAADVVQITLLTAGQGGHGERRATKRGVLLAR